MSLPCNVTVLTPDGNIQLTLASGRVLIVAGPNGTGKSAFLAELYRNLGHQLATYHPGHRQINFNSNWDTIGLSVDQIYATLFSHAEQFNRYRNVWPEEQFKTELRTLHNREAAYNRNFRGRSQSRQSFIIETDAIMDSPVDRVNEIFAQSSLPIRFVMTAEGISAQRGDSEPYSIEKLSDGERAALYIASTFVNRKAGDVLLIDEPEKHLDQSMAALLLDACVRMRNDIATVFSTHDSRIIDRISEKDIVHIRNSEIITDKPERRRYNISQIFNNDASLEGLKKDLMGVRSKVLFIEGEISSLDIPIYTKVYDGVKVLPKGGHQEVCDATRGIGRLVDGHWLEPRGLIDRDGRSDVEVQALESDGIYVLPFPTVENLFFIEQARLCFIISDIYYHGGETEEVRVTRFRSEVVSSAQLARDDIIAKRVSWRVARALSDLKVAPKKIRDGFRTDLLVSVSEIYDEVSSQVDAIIASNDSQEVMSKLPIKNTVIPYKAARALGATNFEEYVKVIMRKIDLAEPEGLNLLNALRNLLPKIFPDQALLSS